LVNRFEPRPKQRLVLTIATATECPVTGRRKRR
jgi:hypothetical protein